MPWYRGYSVALVMNATVVAYRGEPRKGRRMGINSTVMSWSIVTMILMEVTPKLSDETLYDGRGRHAFSFLNYFFK